MSGIRFVTGAASSAVIVYAVVANWNQPAAVTPRIDRSVVAQQAPTSWVRTPSPCTTHPTARGCVTRADARRQVEAAGWTWAQFLTKSTDRASYEQVFIDLVLSSEGS